MVEFGVGYELDMDSALKCERLGFHSVWIPDHLTGGLEGWTQLSALATITSQIRLGNLVLCNSLRNPALLANMAASLDIISKGRLEFGIGAGWLETDYDTCGIPFPKNSVRVAQLRESLTIMKKMWTEERPSYKGKYYKIIDARCPKPVQNPHPPITIGGMGERLTLRVVAEYADRLNFGLPIDVRGCKHKLEVLKEHCKAVGRNYDEIEKSVSKVVLISRKKEEIRQAVGEWVKSFPRFFPNPEIFKNRAIIGTPEECIKQILEYASMGIVLFILSFKNLPEGMRLFAEEVIPNMS